LGQPQSYTASIGLALPLRAGKGTCTKLWHNKFASKHKYFPLHQLMFNFNMSLINFIVLFGKEMQTEKGVPASLENHML